MVGVDEQIAHAAPRQVPGHGQPRLTGAGHKDVEVLPKSCRGIGP